MHTSQEMPVVAIDNGSSWKHMTIAGCAETDNLVSMAECLFRFTPQQMLEIKRVSRLLWRMALACQLML